MVNVYVSLIEKGYRTIEQVPDAWKEDVQKKLDEKAKETTGEETVYRIS